MMLKRLLRKTTIIILGKLFYDKEYIRGKHFSDKGAGARYILQSWYSQKIVGINSDVPWPVSPRVAVVNPKNIVFDPDDIQIFHTYGTYYQAIGAKIILGKGIYIAPNVGLITTNHDVNNLDKHSEGKNIVIKDKCWIGMNSVILPGVTLGTNTIVGAGSIVTKSFPEGFCVIAGNPAKIIKAIKNNKVNTDEVLP